MKILRISLHNLASLAGTHTVDFTQEPLLSAGLFAICGSTGAGKSTLLDALCLALYDDTPRLAREGKQGALQEVDQIILPGDARNLMRRGTAEAWAEVAYVGVDQQTYTARWQVARARKKTNGKLQPSDLSLWRGNVRMGEDEGAPISTQKKATKEAIQTTLGLSFQQFTRAVLLAQNDFATFLKADEAERSEILEALTDTARFSHISVAIHKRRSEGKAALHNLNIQLQGQAPLAEEDRAAAQAEHDAASVAKQQADTDLAHAKTLLAWFQRSAELAHQHQQAQQQLLQAQAARAAAAEREQLLKLTEQTKESATPLFTTEQQSSAALIKAQKTSEQTHAELLAAEQGQHSLHTQLHSAQQRSQAAELALDEATPQLQEARRLDALLPQQVAVEDKAERELKTLSQDLADKLQKEAELTRSHSTASTELQSLAEKLAAHGAWLPFVTDVSAWMQRLSHAQQQQQALHSLQQRHTAEEEGLHQVQQQLSSITQSLPSLEEEKQQLEAKKATLRAELSQHDLQALHSEKEANSKTHHELQLAQTQWQQRQDCSTRLAEVEKLITQQTADSASLSQQLQETETRIKTLQALVTAVEDEVKRLRAQLTEGSACPVCGSHTHPYTQHAPDADAAAVQMQRQHLHRAQQQEKASRAELATLQGSLIQLRSQRQQLEQTLLKLPAPTLADPAAIQDLLAHCAAEAERLTLAIQTQAHRQEELELLSQQIAAAQQRQQALHIEQAKHQTQQAAVQASLTQLQTQLTTTTHAQHAALLELSPLQDTAQEADLTKLKALLEQRSQTLHSWQREQGEQQQIATHATLLLQPLQQDISQLKQRLTLAQTAHQQASQNTTTLRSQRALLLQGKAAEPVEQELKHSLAEAQQALALTRQQHEDALLKKATAQQAATSADTALQQAQQQQQQAQLALQQWLAQHQMPREQLEQLLSHSAEWLQTERDALRALDTAVDQALGSCSTHQQTWQTHQQSMPPDMDEASAQLAHQTCIQQQLTTQARLDAARTVLSKDDDRRSSNALLLAQLAELQRQEAPFQKLDDLLGSADGSKFRTIAQRRTLDYLLEHANQQLRTLAPRYRLERIPKKLGLLMVDQDMGDERRSVASLSGGETFLVSLSLALGLAGITSHRLKIESLFIDEGFGSLDGDTLSLAMHALLQLQAQGRKVGVISHVAEMAESIPVQVRLKRVRAGMSKLEVVG